MIKTMVLEDSIFSVVELIVWMPGDFPFSEQILNYCWLAGAR